MRRVEIGCKDTARAGIPQSIKRMHLVLTHVEHARKPRPRLDVFPLRTLTGCCSEIQPSQIERRPSKSVTRKVRCEGQRASFSIGNIGSAESTQREFDGGIEVEIGPGHPRLLEAVSQRDSHGGHCVA